MSGLPKKLIEVALPLDGINAACKADKDRKTGTIRNLHKWFAPMPLPAWRALLYAALIDDPGDDEKRAYHLGVIKRLVESGADLPEEGVIREARSNIDIQFADGAPPVMDPFCGGGSTLVEAQRLGLVTFGSDLNPVPALITRTLTELLPKVYGQQPLNPEVVTSSHSVARKKKLEPSSKQQALVEMDSDGVFKTYLGYEGLVRDVTYYAEQIREAAWEQLKVHYPSPPGETPIAWLWARTVNCSNPACGEETILTTSWWLSKKDGALAWIEPSVQDGRIVLEVVESKASGAPPDAPKSGRGAAFACLVCGAPIAADVIRSAAAEGPAVSGRLLLLQ